MTEHRKIAPERKAPTKDIPSLFERAQARFGAEFFSPNARVQGQSPVEPAPPSAAAASAERAAPDARPSGGKAMRAPVSRLPMGAVQAVDRTRLEEEGLIVPGSSVTRLIEEFRIIKRQLLDHIRPDPSARNRRILVSSPLPGEGKTFCATNLAISLAQEKRAQVILVDADFANPSVVRRLGLKAQKGFMDGLIDPDCDPLDHLIATDIDGLFVMGAGTPSVEDAELLSSPATARLLDRLGGADPNRILVFDTPPALAASTGGELAKHVGQCLLVARAEETPQGALEDARDLLGGCPQIRLVLNACLFSPSGRRFGAYGNQGEG